MERFWMELRTRSRTRLRTWGLFLFVAGVMVVGVPAPSAFAQMAAQTSKQMPSPAAGAPSSDDAEQAVLAPVHALFDGMAKRDAAAIKAPVLATATLTLMRDGKPTLMTIDDFAARVGKPGKMTVEERIHDPVVRVDNDLAMVWAPFEFLLDGKVDSCGTDLFNLVRVDGKWMIAGIADTGRKECGEVGQLIRE